MQVKKRGKRHGLLWPGNYFQGWGVLCILAPVPTLPGYRIYNVSLRYLPSSAINLILIVEPVFTTLLSYLFFGEMMLAVQEACLSWLEYA